MFIWHCALHQPIPVRPCLLQTVDGFKSQEHCDFCCRRKVCMWTDTRLLYNSLLFPLCSSLSVSHTHTHLFMPPGGHCIDSHSLPEHSLYLNCHHRHNVPKRSFSLQLEIGAAVAEFKENDYLMELLRLCPKSLPL